MPTKDISIRPRAYDKREEIWRMEQLPEGNSFRKVAVFVVHGMGAHTTETTAVTLRYGFEDAGDRLSRSGIYVPPIYIKEGYWGDFPDIEETMPEQYATLNESEKTFFRDLWKTRSESASRTAAWFAQQAMRLPGQVLGFGEASAIRVGLAYRLFRFVAYLLVIAVTFLTLFAFLLIDAGRKILAKVLGDVRLYLMPKGDVERAIVQGIDRRVGGKFLELLGLDWKFQDLPLNRQLRVGGELHKFEKVIWVAHSLGTVVSYNVISDLLARCKKFRTNSTDPALLANVERVENGLHRFVTIGSPLQKVAVLFSSALRRWPADYLRAFLAQKERQNGCAWWVNFYDIFDPVSGVLRQRDYFEAAHNHHSTNQKPLPGLAHVLYWHTPGVTEYILKQTLPNPDHSLMNCPDGFLSGLWRHALMFAFLLLAVILELTVYFVAGLLLAWVLRRFVRAVVFPGLKWLWFAGGHGFHRLQRLWQAVFC